MENAYYMPTLSEMLIKKMDKIVIDVFNSIFSTPPCYSFFLYPDLCEDLYIPIYVKSIDREGIRLFNV